MGRVWGKRCYFSIASSRGITGFEADAQIGMNAIVAAMNLLVLIIVMLVFNDCLQYIC